MWKAALVLVLLFAAGHFAVRYLRTNPLDPVIEGGEVVVSTKEYAIRLAREGRVEGTYLVTAAKSDDFGNEPANVTLTVVDFAATASYLRAYPDFHRYGAMPELQLGNASTLLALIAANRVVYGELHGLGDLFEERSRARGERICLTISGEALRVSAVAALETGIDRAGSLEGRNDERQRVLVNEVRIEDCVDRLAGR